MQSILDSAREPSCSGPRASLLFDVGERVSPANLRSVPGFALSFDRVAKSREEYSARLGYDDEHRCTEHEHDSDTFEKSIGHFVVASRSSPEGLQTGGR